MMRRARHIAMLGAAVILMVIFFAVVDRQSRVDFVEGVREPGGSNATGDVFRRQEGVAVVTKVHGPDYLGQLKQMLCLLTQAYNKHVGYDVLVFTTIPWSRDAVQALQDVIAPAALTVALDSRTLHEELAEMGPEELQFLLHRCNVTTAEELQWTSRCCLRFCTTLKYAWQAEFRAYHIWRHPALTRYKYMLWMDSDSLCSKPWEHDPVRVMVENNLVLLGIPCCHFPEHDELMRKMKAAYGKMICSVRLNESSGSLLPRVATEEETHDGKCKGRPAFHMAAGHFHVTNLDFYRLPTNLKFLELLVSPHRFNRDWDDQLAVFAPAAVEAPDRVWNVIARGLSLGLVHNKLIDYNFSHRLGTHFDKWFKQEGGPMWQWPDAKEACEALIKYSG